MMYRVALNNPFSREETNGWIYHWPKHGITFTTIGLIHYVEALQLVRIMARRIPDKYIAIGLFLLLLGLYLWTHDETLRYLMSGMFALVCMAIGDGLRRVTDSFKARLKDGEHNGIREPKLSRSEAAKGDRQSRVSHQPVSPNPE